MCHMYVSSDQYLNFVSWYEFVCVVRSVCKHSYCHKFELDATIFVMLIKTMGLLDKLPNNNYGFLSKWKERIFNNILETEEKVILSWLHSTFLLLITY